MYTYDLLETGCYYLVKEKEDSPINMIKVAVESDHCLFIQRFDNTSTKTITGTFSGTAFDNISMSMKTITNGTFTAVYP